MSSASASAIAVAARAKSAARSLLLIPRGNVPAVRLRDMARVSLALTELDVPPMTRATSVQDENGTPVDFGQALHQRWHSVPRRDNARAGWITAFDFASGAGLTAVGLQWSRKAAQLIDADEYRYVITVLESVDGARNRLAVRAVSLWNDLAGLNLPVPASTGLLQESVRRLAGRIADDARSVMTQQQALGVPISAVEAVRIVMGRQRSLDAEAARRGDLIVASFYQAPAG